MPKSLDSIRKLSEQELKKSREVVLKYLAETEAEERPVAESVKAFKKVDGLITKKIKAPISLKQIQASQLEPIQERKPMLDQLQKEKIIKEKERLIEQRRAIQEQEKLKELEQQKLEEKKRREQEEAARRTEKEKQRLEKEKAKQEEKLKREAESREKALLKKQEKEKRKLARSKKIKKFKSKIKAIFLSWSEKMKAIVSQWKLASWLLGYLILLVFFSYLIFWLILVNFQLNDSLTRKIAKVVPWPVLITNRGVAYYYDYQDLKNLVGQINNQTAQRAGKQKINFEQQLIKNFIYQKLIKKYHLSFSDAEINQAYESAISADKASANFEKELYLKFIILPSLLEKKLSQQIVFDQTINYSALARIKKIEQQIKLGSNFEQIKNFCDQVALAEIITVELINEKFGDIINNLSDGQLSQIITTADGYYLVQKVSQNTDGLVLNYAFIKAKTLEQYLAEQLKQVYWIKLVNF